jgi:hypothetical protein
MDKKKKKLARKVEDTMACSAYAESGEPCPIDNGEKKTEKVVKSEKPGKGKKSPLQSVEDTMACTAYAESSEPCPIADEKK